MKKIPVFIVLFFTCLLQIVVKHECVIAQPAIHAGDNAFYAGALAGATDLIHCNDDSIRSAINTFSHNNAGELIGLAYARRASYIATCPSSANAISYVTTNGLGTPVIKLNWTSVAFASMKCDLACNHYLNVANDTLSATIDFVISGLPAGTPATLHYRLSANTYAKSEDEAFMEDMAKVEGVSVSFMHNNIIAPGTFDITGRGFHYLPAVDGSVTVNNGDTIQISMSAFLQAYIADPPRFYPAALPRDRAMAFFAGQLDLWLQTPDICDPEELLFSLDIGSDAELSDSLPDGNEVFDPGDAYTWQGPMLPAGGQNGTIDDAFLFGIDPHPTPPDPSLMTAAPVCSTGASFPVEQLNFHDMDGIDIIDYSLWLNFNNYGPGKPPIDTFFSQCIYRPDHLVISYDDDGPVNYTGSSFSCDVPVNNPSPRGSAADADEIMGGTAVPLPGGGKYAFFITQGLAEHQIHQSLMPDPDTTHLRFNDDLDALDIVPANTTCNIIYFSVDHEATWKNNQNQPFNPGAIYEYSIYTGTATLVIDPVFHLGLPAGVDIDAFEFAWIRDSITGQEGLGLLFSVDEDDWLTSQTDESGGLNPAAIYCSFLNGYSFELSDIPANDDIDGLAMGCGDIVGQVILGSCSPPQQIWASKITPVSARLNWTAVANAVQYQIRGRITGASTWRYLTVNAPITYRDVYGLYNNTTIEWQVRTFCTNGDTSVWSSLDSFTTGCQTPDSLWVNPLLCNAARLNWSHVTGAVGYEIRGRKAGGNWINILVGGGFTHHKDVYGLSPNTTYHWRIRTWCDINGVIKSPYAPLNTFVTPPCSPRLGGGVTFMEEGNPLMIVPNPATGRATLYFNNPAGTVYQLRILDMRGKVVYRQDGLTGESVLIEQDGMPAGVYILELRGETLMRGKLIWQ